MADRVAPRQRGQHAVVKDGGHETHVLHDRDELAVAHGHARGFLPAMLQRIQAEVGDVGDRLARGVDPEDPAGLLGRVVDQVERGRIGGGSSCGRVLRINWARGEVLGHGIIL